MAAKYFAIGVNENDETGVDFNSFVDVPAHLKGMIYFGKDKAHYSFNDERRIVTGVMIAVNQPIYRWTPEIGDHYVVFDAPTTDLIRRKFFKNGYNQNLNKMHDPNQQTHGAVLIDSYIVNNSDPRYPNVPEAFDHMNLQNGSWIASYHVHDDALWEEVKSGKFGGFSVEGWFEKKKINVKSNMKKERRSIWSMFTANNEPEPAQFAQATTADGTVVFYEGDLAEGTAVFVELDGTQVPAPEGDHQLTLEDGSIKVISVDGNGIVTSIEDVNPNDMEAQGDDIREEVAETMRKFAAEVHDRFAVIEKDNADLKEENAALKAELEALKSAYKFKNEPRRADSKPEGYRSLLSK